MNTENLTAVDVSARHKEILLKKANEIFDRDFFNDECPDLSITNRELCIKSRQMLSKGKFEESIDNKLPTSLSCYQDLKHVKHMRTVYNAQLTAKILKARDTINAGWSPEFERENADSSKFIAVWYDFAKDSYYISHLYIDEYIGEKLIFKTEYDFEIFKKYISDQEIIEYLTM